MDSYYFEVEKLLSALSPQKQLIFAFLTIEKLVPNYAYFSNLHSWGDSQILTESQLLIYNSIFERDTTGYDIKDIYTRLEEATPDTEDFSSISASFALDACTSVLSTLDFLSENDLSHIVEVAIFARDTVDMYIQEVLDFSPNDKILESKIAENDFMIREKMRQSSIVTNLLNSEEVLDSTLVILRAIQPLPIIDLNLLT
jgi:uncharacterized protein